VTTVGTAAPIFPPGFVEDRSTMVEGGISVERLLTDMPAQREQLRAKLDILETHLASGTPFVLGAAASLADFALFHPVYTLKIIPQTAEILAPYVNLRRWIERIEAFGHGKPAELASGAAVDIAKSATPIRSRGVGEGEPNGFAAGDRIEIVHEDFGRDPVIGELVEASANEIALKRSDPRVGEVVVHFPREHYKARRL
jgi:glutathione S-transferase